MAIEWTNDLSVNVGNIDKQHQEIFVRYDGFLDACRNGKGREIVLELLDFLTSYVDEHFDHEEKFMKEYNYPDTETHVKEHRDLVQTVQKFRARLTLQGATISLIAEINKTLLDWLVDHIKRSDMELGSFLNKKWGLF